MMNEIVHMTLVLTAGCVLGTLFFGGLWLTIKKMRTTKITPLFIIASFVLRMGVVLLGFYFLAAKNWQNILVCLLGFIVARFAILRLTKPSQVIYTAEKNEL